MTNTTNPGDCLIHERAEGLFDIWKVNDSGGRAPVRENFRGSPQGVRDIARAELRGGRLWFSHHSSPDSLEPYS